MIETLAAIWLGIFALGVALLIALSIVAYIAEEMRKAIEAEKRWSREKQKASN